MGIIDNYGERTQPCPQKPDIYTSIFINWFVKRHKVVTIKAPFLPVDGVQIYFCNSDFRPIKRSMEETEMAKQQEMEAIFRKKRRDGDIIFSRQSINRAIWVVFVATAAKAWSFAYVDYNRIMPTQTSRGWTFAQSKYGSATLN